MKKKLKANVEKSLIVGTFIGALAAMQGIAIENYWLAGIGMLPVIASAWIFYPE